MVSEDPSGWFAFVVHVHTGAALGLAAALTVGLAAYLRLTSPYRLGLAP